jgi:biopolymer transport protein ExbB
MSPRFRFLLPLILFVCALGANVAFAADEPAAAAPAADTKHHDKNLMEVIKEGGVIMIPLALVSAAMLTIIVIEGITLRRKKLVPDDQVATLRSYFQNGDYQAAVEYCRTNPGFFTDVVYTGMLCVGQGKDVAEQAMGDTLAKGVATLSTRNYYLNLIGVVTPMLGLTGTVLGMMKAFSTIGASGIGDPSALAGAIGEVLVATATGLFIAIPAFTAYYIFRNWITGATAYCEDHINTLFRGMPYHDMERVWFGAEPIFAARPNWLQNPPDATASPAA